MDTHDVATTKAGGENHQWILDIRPEGKLTGTLPTGSSVQEEQNGLYEEIRQLRLEVERLRDEQKALQRTPQSNDFHDADEVEDHEGDDSNARDPADRRGVLHRRPIKLILALVVAAILSVGGLRFWNYLQSYEWTDDAEIDGHLDPISTRIDDTVIRVYVENTYHVKAGQPWSISIRATTRSQSKMRRPTSLRRSRA